MQKLEENNLVTRTYMILQILGGQFMRKTVSVLLFCALLLIIAIQPLSAADYILGPGDVLAVSVYGYEELETKELIVRPDGKLAFPLVGEIQAAGLTAGGFTNTLTTALSQYVVNPLVTVNVGKYHTTRVYVFGEVTKPGLYEIEKQHNLLDAVGMAGGYTQNAAKKNIFVVHKDNPQKPEKINLLKLLEKGDMSQNVTLADGDVVYLTKNHKISFARDILPYVSALYQVNEMNDN